MRDLASLAARLGVGGIFFANGWHKLEYGLTATGDQFARMDAPAPAVWAAATMLIELIGGALLVAGLAVPACGLVLFAEALAVFALVSGDTGLPLTGGDINLIVALGAASVLLAVVGAGRLSVDHLVVIRRREAEAEDEMAADKEADDVISSWREASRPAPADAVADADGPATNPIPRTGTGKTSRAGAAGAPSTAGEPAGAGEPAAATGPRKARPRRPARTAEPAGTTSPAGAAPADARPDAKPADAAPGQDRLVAGRRTTPAPDAD
ncbi:hypothetical protein Sru01_48520 [Sphaerisporangium rufum]|uniref:DoxX family protein n=1 Tax=Sphaerisporangium rufum TaxID=1381558 RepID=A0A919R7Y8_9ACTN|nr:hypothetical protein Sru01_48520 [Sphaerisporangium rufum]